jgi:hypothetical protein
MTQRRISPKSNRSGFWVLGTVGVLLSLYACLMPLLGWVGERTMGQITVLRRELGDRQDPLPNRYSWSIGFEFHLPDGRLISGNSKSIGDAQSAGIAKGPQPVRYLAVFPHLNALERDTHPDLGKLVLLVVGIGLCALAFKLRRTG